MKVSPSTTWYFDYQHQSHYPTQASLESVATASNTTHCGGTSLPLKSNAPFPLNTKEYIAAVIAALISLQNDPCEHPCVLSLGDSSTTTSWLHKSNHVPASSPVHNEIARWHASNLLEHQASDYSQHIAGSDNHVADSLSRDFHLNDEQLLSSALGAPVHEAQSSVIGGRRCPSITYRKIHYFSPPLFYRVLARNKYMRFLVRRFTCVTRRVLSRAYRRRICMCSSVESEKYLLKARN